MIEDELLDYAQKISDYIYNEEPQYTIEVVQSKESIILSVNKVATIIKKSEMYSNSHADIAQSILFAVKQLYSFQNEESDAND